MNANVIVIKDGGLDSVLPCTTEDHLDTVFQTTWHRVTTYGKPGLYVIHLVVDGEIVTYETIKVD